MPVQKIYNYPDREKEVWKPLRIDGVRDIYQISSYGRVRNDSGKILSIYYDKDGYVRHTLQLINGKKRHYFSHRLVGQNFIPNPMNKPEINHKGVVYFIDIENGVCYNKCKNDDNYYKNLEWCTRGENIKHSMNNRLQDYLTCDKHGYAKFSNEEVDTICKLITEGYSDIEICVNLGVKDKGRYNQVKGLIKNIISSCNGRRNGGPLWKEITRNYKIPDIEERRLLIKNRG